MDDATRERIERECERLVIAYTHRTDFDSGKPVADLFADDGILDTGIARLEGREQFLAAAAARDPATRMHHTCTNTLIDVLDADHATGVTYLTAYVATAQPGAPAPMSEPAVVGRYHDEFVRTPAGWRFASRKVVPVFARGS